jgi:hypothetical protein
MINLLLVELCVKNGIQNSKKSFILIDMQHDMLKLCGDKL